MKKTKKQIAAEHAERMALIYAETAAALQNNICPTCRGPVRRNLALTGWVQCEQYGAPGFRAHAHLARCLWQGFTQ